MRTGQYKSSICDLVVRFLCNALKISADILYKDSVYNKILKFKIRLRTEAKLYFVKEFIGLNKIYFANVY